jgi:hypothetical protein
MIFSEFPNLTSLNLSRTKVTDIAVKRLISCEPLKNQLRSLYLVATKVSEKSTTDFLGMQGYSSLKLGFPSLCQLFLWASKFSQPQISKLKDLASKKWENISLNNRWEFQFQTLPAPESSVTIKYLNRFLEDEHAFIRKSLNGSQFLNIQHNFRTSIETVLARRHSTGSIPEIPKEQLLVPRFSLDSRLPQRIKSNEFVARSIPEEVEPVICEPLRQNQLTTMDLQNNTTNFDSTPLNTQTAAEVVNEPQDSVAEAAVAEAKPPSVDLPTLDLLQADPTLEKETHSSSLELDEIVQEPQTDHISAKTHPEVIVISDDDEINLHPVRSHYATSSCCIIEEIVLSDYTPDEEEPCKHKHTKYEKRKYEEDFPFLPKCKVSIVEIDGCPRELDRDWNENKPTMVG